MYLNRVTHLFWKDPAEKYLSARHKAGLKALFPSVLYKFVAGRSVIFYISDQQKTDVVYPAEVIANANGDVFCFLASFPIDQIDQSFSLTSLRQNLQLL